MNGDFKPHFDAIHQWIDAQRELLSPVPKISPDERKEQHAVDRSMNQLTKVGVSIFEDQQVLRLELPANKGSREKRCQVPFLSSLLSDPSQRRVTGYCGHR